MTLNFDTWFMRRFLGYGRYSVPPKTICELGRVILLMSVLWLSITTSVLFMLSLYLTGLFGVFYVMLTDATLAEFFNFGVEKETWTFTAWLFFVISNIFMTIFGIVFAIKFGGEYYKEHIRLEELKTTPSPIKEFFKGVWARIHDKTCTVIEWQNDPATLRERTWEEFRARCNTPISNSENNA